MCTGMRGNQHFIYDFKSFHIVHVSTHLCLDCDLESKKVFMERCNRTSKTQQWIFLSYNETLILKDMQQYFLEWYETSFCVLLRSSFCDTIYYFLYLVNIKCATGPKFSTTDESFFMINEAINIANEHCIFIDACVSMSQRINAKKGKRMFTSSEYHQCFWFRSMKVHRRIPFFHIVSLNAYVHG